MSLHFGCEALTIPFWYGLLTACCGRWMRQQLAATSHQFQIASLGSRCVFENAYYGNYSKLSSEMFFLKITNYSGLPVGDVQWFWFSRLAIFNIASNFLFLCSFIYSSSWMDNMWNIFYPANWCTGLMMLFCQSHRCDFCDWIWYPLCKEAWRPAPVTLLSQ